MHAGFSWHLILLQACLSFPPSHSTISSILGAWLDQYSEDFRKPPDFACLKQLISYVRHNIPGSDLERRARILLAQFQQQEQSESEAEGGVLSLLMGVVWGCRGRECNWLASRVSKTLGLAVGPTLINPARVYMEVYWEANPTAPEVGSLNGLANLPLILCRHLCPGLK